jgi:ribonuclease P/MRP protein subunit RPP20
MTSVVRLSDITITPFRYRNLRLHAMGAAIPHALMLATSLPATLPFPSDEIKTSILTGTVRCIDEVIPDVADEEDDEGGTRTRDKSCIDVSIVIGDGVKVDAKGRKKVGATKAAAAVAPKEQGGKAQGTTKPLLPTKPSTSA